MSANHQLLPQLIAITNYSEPEAIASWINTRLNSPGITTKAVIKDSCLGILLEANSAPNQQEMMAVVRQSVDELQLTQIRRVRVYGRQSGERLLWQQEFAIASAHNPPAQAAPISVTDWLNQGLVTTAEPEMVETDIPADTEGKFLRFQFGSEVTALLPLDNVKEVLKISTDEILPVPDMPDSVLGVYNCRGEMLWLVDLNAQLGFFSFFSPDSQYLAFGLSHKLNLIAIQADDKSLGIVVPEVMDIEIHSLQEWQTPPTGLFLPRLLPFIQAYLTDASSPVLDAKALIEDSQLQMHSFN